VDLLTAYSKRPDLLFDLARAVTRLCREEVSEPDGVHSVRSGQAPLSDVDVVGSQCAAPYA
jgi:hypothetical protein